MLEGQTFLLTFLQIDLVPPEVVTAWKHYYSTKFEELNVVCFTSFPKDESERKREPGKGTLMWKYLINSILLIIERLLSLWFNALFV